MNTVVISVCSSRSIERIWSIFQTLGIMCKKIYTFFFQKLHEINISNEQKQNVKNYID